ncbi:MAG: GntR family transcriptional regulator [Gammaproteobacteria bacterium]|nr:GntR family transcriptional regulator [Gammaproteobacteria bacterium]
MGSSRPGTQSLQSRTYRALRRSILDGDFVPGRAVTIRGIAEDLGISPTPVREALRRLVAERALTLSATGRVSVPVMTREKLAELVNARICLERQAAIDAVPGITDRVVSRLVRLNRAIDRAIEAGDRRRYLVTHRDFHFTLYRVGGGEVFLPLIESVWLQISPFLRYTLSGEHRSRYSTSDRHVEIIEALERRDATALGFAVEADIRHGIGALIESDWNRPDDAAAGANTAGIRTADRESG